MGSIDEAKANAKRLRKANTEVNNESTEGYIGRLDEILREAAIASLSRGYKKGRW
ncbi:hypothetical protein H1P_5830003 [Hyella patelloides LEGE 07179]|uniref:Uncharacterized protein n=1 Tax=Hyella patelloides LEGE 07179 TaxID=945734 RepID=A0A563W0S1_9CYAN|nr:hypothetical protein [Hyella patelloides]VEP17294.1 hypothetical protein H1P_5830003 [Hyella patelloides LEGE 07179]